MAKERELVFGDRLTGNMTIAELEEIVGDVATDAIEDGIEPSAVVDVLRAAADELEARNASKGT